MGSILAVLLVIFLVAKRDRNDFSYEKGFVNKGDVKKTIGVDAKVVPDIYADISSELPATIKTVEISKGDNVKKGQVLFTLDESSLNAQIQNAKLSLEKAKLAEEKSRRKWDDLKPEERESIKKTTEQARQKLAEILAQKDKLVVVSPIDGLVVKQNARVGEVAGKKIIRIIQQNSLKLEALIPEVDLSKIKTGNQVSINLDAYPDKTLKGKITEIDKTSTVNQGNTYYKANIDLNNNSEREMLLDGMNADVNIEINSRKNIKVISRKFSKRDDNGYFVYIIGSDQKSFNKKYFKEGLIGDNNVEVISGLNLKEEIVLPKSQN